MAGMFESARRPLKPAETRFLQAKIKNLLRRGRRTSRVYLPITAGITVILWLVTILVADAPLLVVTGFWLITGAGALGTSRRNEGRDPPSIDGAGPQIRAEA